MGSFVMMPVAVHVAGFPESPLQCSNLQSPSCWRGTRSNGFIRNDASGRLRGRLSCVSFAVFESSEGSEGGVQVSLSVRTMNASTSRRCCRAYVIGRLQSVAPISKPFAVASTFSRLSSFLMGKCSSSWQNATTCNPLSKGLSLDTESRSATSSDGPMSGSMGVCWLGLSGCMILVGRHAQEKLPNARGCWMPR